MSLKENILSAVKKEGSISVADIAKSFGFSRQHVSNTMSILVSEKKLFKVGSTRGAFYILPEKIKDFSGQIKNIYSKSLINKNLEEHKVLDDIEKSFLTLNTLPENIKSIFTYAFSEMLNNAIEHSTSDKIKISVALEGDVLSFIVDDMGVGVYRNIMNKRRLNGELEAIQDLLKGKMTTAPKLHSGEGIFFTSKIGDSFILDSYGYQFIADNTIPDIFVNKVKGIKQGTKVTFSINIKDKQHLNDVFKKYTNLTSGSDFGFDKTEIRVRLYIIGGVHISRSQARRVLVGLDKFKVIVMDYEGVPMIGQAFADEIYRVFSIKHSDIKIEDINTNEAVEFMIKRAKQEAGVSKE